MSDKNFELQSEQIRFHTEQRKVSDLIPYEKNPRFLTPQQEIELTASLKIKYHPTVKPLEMVCDALLDCSHPQGLILDLFMGSGTTLVASERTGRICYGMELDEAYVEVAIHRYHNYMQQQGKPTPFIHLNGSLKLEKILP